MKNVIRTYRSLGLKYFSLVWYQLGQVFLIFYGHSEQDVDQVLGCRWSGLVSRDDVKEFAQFFPEIILSITFSTFIKTTVKKKI
jgi:hypothetical protein